MSRVSVENNGLDERESVLNWSVFAPKKIRVWSSGNAFETRIDKERERREEMGHIKKR
jgi:hypothetical protein